MFKSFKINTAIFICAAFVLKLLVVNVGLLSPTPKNTSASKMHVSLKTKRRKTLEASTTSGGTEYLAEICEEDSDEETQLKSNPFLLIHVLYAIAGAKIISGLKKIIPLSRNFSYTETNRHLALQVIKV